MGPAVTDHRATFAKSPDFVVRRAQIQPLRDDHRRNGFDLLRLLAALSVVVSHSVAVGEGRPRDQPLLAWSGQLTLGEIGVAVFLIISGYLVTASAEHRDARSFVLARGLRIFPALVVVVAASIFVLGPLMTTDPDYWSDIRTAVYALNALLVAVPTLPGVFEGNSFGAVVNGSLWTIAYEVMFYTGLIVLVTLGFGGRRWLLATLGGLLLATVLVPESMLFRLGAFFAGGAVIYRLRGSLPLTWPAAIICAGTVAVAGHLGFGLVPALATVGAYLLVTLAFRLPPFDAARYGDLSYGIYLTAFPIQQALTQLGGGQMAWWANASLAIPLAGLAAFALWHGVEKRALAMKPTIRMPSTERESVRSTLLRPDIVVVCRD
jgi:peptidoglycan/LPS O-acetylase OafA/YrhL